MASDVAEDDAVGVDDGVIVEEDVHRLAGEALLVEAARVFGLDAAMAAALEPWMSPGARHHPGKILLDLGLSVALGGDCLASLGTIRCEPGVYGPVAFRLIARLGASDKAEKAVQGTITEARAAAWGLAGESAPHATDQDSHHRPTIITSRKEEPTPAEPPATEP